MKKKAFILMMAVILTALSVSASAIDFTGNDGEYETEFGDAQPITTDDYKEVSISTLKDDGQIRVYLKSLNLPLSMTVETRGEYSVDHNPGMRFRSGSSLIFSDGGDRIYMTVGGFTMDMGKSVQLTRQASEKEVSAFSIVETQRENLYPGDMKLTLAEGGGLKCVLTLNIEDYLHGVIAYEMSDAWPIEALKSQAIAARTYAMQAKGRSKSRDYDLVDTTADQVYRGTDASLMNVDAAVVATTGVVGLYKGSYATCYYTASNGGEVALPSDVFGSSDGDFGYLDRREDPYDLENPNSVVKSLSVSADCSESPELKALIEEGIREQAIAAGENADDLELNLIVSMEPIDPIPADSKMYRKLRVTAGVVRRVQEFVPSIDDIGAPTNATGEPFADMALAGVDVLRRVYNDSPYEAEDTYEEVETQYTVDLDVYEQLKALGLEINTLDCELISVESGQFGFTISMRRFGHGVGMSQRGAQRMAGGHGMRWRDILGFYYPGLAIERIEWNTPELEAMDPLPEYVGMMFTAPTVLTETKELPALRDGEHYAVVALNNVSSTLNMRAMPTTDSRIVALLAEGQKLIVSSAADANGWVSVHTAELEGYVKEEYLKDAA